MNHDTVTLHATPTQVLALGEAALRALAESWYYSEPSRYEHVAYTIMDTAHKLGLIPEEHK